MRHPCQFWNGEAGDCAIRQMAFGIADQLNGIKNPTAPEIPEDLYKEIFPELYSSILERGG